jgi:hypothetical protein
VRPRRPGRALFRAGRDDHDDDHGDDDNGGRGDFDHEHHQRPASADPTA